MCVSRNITACSRNHGCYGKAEMRSLIVDIPIAVNYTKPLSTDMETQQ
jgi:hypothetical protein